MWASNFGRFFFFSCCCFQPSPPPSLSDTPLCLSFALICPRHNALIALSNTLSVLVVGRMLKPCCKMLTYEQKKKPREENCYLLLIVFTYFHDTYPYSANTIIFFVLFSYFFLVSVWCVRVCVCPSVVLNHFKLIFFHHRIHMRDVVLLCFWSFHYDYQLCFYCYMYVAHLIVYGLIEK